MRKLSILLAALLVMSVSQMTLAGSDIPELKGTWLLEALGVKHNKTPGENPKTHSGDKPGHVQAKAKIIIDKQDGFRFSGTKESPMQKERVSGVIGFDNKTMYVVDDDGMCFWQLVAPDKIQQIYLHVTKQHSIAGRGILTRQR
jgi:hypothetical protein